MASNISYGCSLIAPQREGILKQELGTFFHCFFDGLKKSGNWSYFPARELNCSGMKVFLGPRTCSRGNTHLGGNITGLLSGSDASSILVTYRTRVGGALQLARLRFIGCSLGYEYADDARSSLAIGGSALAVANTPI